jgi:hypothetical protein
VHSISTTSQKPNSTGQVKRFAEEPTPGASGGRHSIKGISLLTLVSKALATDQRGISHGQGPTGSIYGLPSPPQAIERLSWQIWAPLGVYGGAEAELADFTDRELWVTVTPGDVDVSAAAVPAKLSALAIIVVAMTVVLKVVFISFRFRWMILVVASPVGTNVWGPCHRATPTSQRAA